MTNSNHSPFILLPVLQNVALDRLQRAVAAYAAGDYTVTVTCQDERGAWGYLKNGSSPEYGVVLTDQEQFCSCPDRMYRQLVCKHMVILALHILRTLPPEKAAA